ncbi:protein stoned-A [Belonocnema kinseyi]|uniref:protein stoned-A n=1 Tax=Belonocnema kinseyi TaxID=2817044 RepID=UPI00143D1C75|nr:protein stoned-A [Belonocnema kinseyi]XP_033221337.1 protein stoned-A [Belonocnema kinseyi]
MHKLAKGLKKKKKQKKGKKGTEEEEFEPEELERYRRDRAEAQLKLSEEKSETGTGSCTSDEWKKFEALTAGVDSILKKSQGDLDRIKTTSFFQRKVLIEEKQFASKHTAGQNKHHSKNWLGFHKAGSSIAENEKDEVADREFAVNEGGFVNVSDYDQELNYSSEDDIFDTTYIDVLQSTDVKLAHIPDSPTKEEQDNDPFDTSSAERVLKTVDRKGKKLVSLGNAVEVLAGRIDHVSTCKLQTTEKRKNQNLLLDDDIILNVSGIGSNVTNLLDTNRTLLDDDSDFFKIKEGINNFASFSSVASSFVDQVVETSKVRSDIRLDVSEFETLKESTVLQEIPNFDDSEFNLNTPSDEKIIVAETQDPFSAKELLSTEFQNAVVEASFEVATFANEKDPFDTTFADNIFPSKVELKFIERELEELPITAVSISLTDPAGLNRDYETGLLKQEGTTTSIISLGSSKRDFLGSSAIDLSRLADQPILPAEEITYVDPFDTSSVQEFVPGKTELKFLEQELLESSFDNCEPLEDKYFDLRNDEKPKNVVTLEIQRFVQDFQIITGKEREINQVEENPKDFIYTRKTSKPDILKITPCKVVAFELPKLLKQPDLFATNKEENAISPKPLTPYFRQLSLEESAALKSDPHQVLDPFDTSFVSEVTPSKTELKLIESELLKTEIFKPKAAVISNQNSLEKKQASREYMRKETNKDKLILKKPESILDSAIKVDIEPLTPRVQNQLTDKVEILYSDPFDTSSASNILPGKAELKILENELSQVPDQVQFHIIPINLIQVPVSCEIKANELNSHIHEGDESKAFLCLDGKDPGNKTLTPVQDKTFLTEEIDPFNGSFNTVGLGKSELKLLES